MADNSLNYLNKNSRTEKLNISLRIVRQQFNSFSLVNFGNIEGKPGSPEHYIQLKEEYQLFLSEEFTSVRKNVYSNSKNESDTDKTALWREISYTYKNTLIKINF